MFLDPKDMTPEERLEEIIELLAIASVRLAEKERREFVAAVIHPSLKPAPLDSSANPLYPSVPKGFPGGLE